MRDLQRATRAQRDQCFNLLFVPVDGQTLGDGIYRLHRRGGSPSELFLSGVNGGMMVQALVNRALAR